MTKTVDRPVILFDGVCNLCNKSVSLIIDNDPGRHFYYASLQSEIAQELLAGKTVDSKMLDSVLLVEGDKVYDRSTAALRIARRMKGLWSWFYAFIIVPAFLRDFFYKIIARNRYRWFGKKNTCRLPTPEERELFLA